MTLDSSTIAALAVSGTTVVVLVFSVLLLNRLRQWGTLERALARTVIDTTARRAFLVGISTLAGTFVAMGAISIVANLGLVTDAVDDAVTTAIFCSGAVGLLYMIYNGFYVSRLTLSDELNLRDFAPEVYTALNAAQPSAPADPAWLYVSPPVDGSPEHARNGSPSLRW